MKAVGQDGGGALNVRVRWTDVADLGLGGWPSGGSATEPRGAGRRALCAGRGARESLSWGASSCQGRKADRKGPYVGCQMI